MCVQSEVMYHEFLFLSNLLLLVSTTKCVESMEGVCVNESWLEVK